jgi:serine/threonine protein phosphatase PrpC
VLTQTRLQVHISSGGCTDVGRIRTNNEDAYRVVAPLNLFVLSDGMGGEAHGEVASALAVETVSNHCLEGGKDPSADFFGTRRGDLSERTNRLASAVQLANRKIFESASQNPQQRGMGATVTALWLDGTRMSVAHVGDSRAYLLRTGALEQLTRDHSLVAEQVRRGILTPQQADRSEMQSVLIRALGTQEDVEVDADEFSMMDGDTVLLCSDGLTRMVTDPEIASTLLMQPDAQTAAERLVTLANEYGGEDNVTVVVVNLQPASNGFFARLRRWMRLPPDVPASGGGN